MPTRAYSGRKPHTARFPPLRLITLAVKVTLMRTIEVKGHDERRGE